MQKELDIILNHFPQFRGRIIELYNSNEDFKLLCEDYWQCRAALQKYRANLSDDTSAEKEYSRLCADLESDAIRFLEHFK